MVAKTREWDVSADWARDLIVAFHEQLTWLEAVGEAPGIKLRLVTHNNPLSSAVALTRRTEQACIMKCDLLIDALAAEPKLVNSAKHTTMHYRAWRRRVPDAPLPCGA